MTERDVMLQTWNKNLIQNIPLLQTMNLWHIFPRLMPLHVFTSFDRFVFDRVICSSRRIFRFLTPPRKIWAK